MTTKRDLIENKLDNIQLYALSQKLPFVAKMKEMRKSYDTDQITALVIRFLVPAKECLREYITAEMERGKLLMVGQTDSESKAAISFVPTTEQLDFLVDAIRYVIKVIEL
jgi:S-ribosylhomocysteine lyase LuxS involved in autoinducer biosynthesis